MSEIRDRIAEALPASLNSQHRAVLAERIEAALWAALRHRDAQWCRELNQVFETTVQLRHDDTTDLEDAIGVGLAELERENGD